MAAEVWCRPTVPNFLSELVCLVTRQTSLPLWSIIDVMRGRRHLSVKGASVNRDACSGCMLLVGVLPASAQNEKTSIKTLHSKKVSGCFLLTPLRRSRTGPPNSDSFTI